QNAGELGRQTSFRRAVDLGALELPCHETMMVEMVDSDPRPRTESLQQISERLLLGRRRAKPIELDLEPHLVASHLVATDCAGGSVARAAEHAVRRSGRHLATPDRLVGSLANAELLIEHVEASWGDEKEPLHPTRKAAPEPRSGARHGRYDRR